MISISPSLAPSHFYSWKLLSLEWPLLAPFSHHTHVRFSLSPLFLFICSIFIPKRLLAFRSTYYTDHLTISSYSISHLWIPLIMSFPLIVRHGASPKLRLSSVPTRYFWQEWQGGLRSPVPDSSSPAPHPVQDGIGLNALSRRCKSQIKKLQWNPEVQREMGIRDAVTISQGFGLVFVAFVYPPTESQTKLFPIQKYFWASPR